MNYDWISKHDFEDFLHNDFAHLKEQVNSLRWRLSTLLWLVGLVLAGIIAEWATK